MVLWPVAKGGIRALADTAAWRPADPRLLIAMSLAMMALDTANGWVRDDIMAVTLIWPGSGLLLGVALVVSRAHLPSVILVGFLTMVARAALTQQPVAIIFGAAGVKSLAIWWAGGELRRWIGPGRDLTRAGALGPSCLVALMASVPPAVLVMAVRIATTGPATVPAFASIAMANMLGMLVVAPFILALHREELREQFDARHRRWAIMTFALLTLCVALVFYQSKLPLLFLTFPPLLLVVSRQGFAGSTLAVLIITVIATVSTVLGHGPTKLSGPDRLDQGLVLQGYLIAIAATAFFMGTLIAERRRLDMALIVRETRARFAEAKMRRSEQKYRQLSENASDIVSRIDLRGRRLYISQSAEEILGWSVAELQGEGWRSHIHPDDQVAFDSTFLEGCEPREQWSISYRCARRDGSWAWIDARIRLIRDSQGAPLEYISNARDVTLQKETEKALEAAMGELSVLATTDGLTGLANRRRFDEALRREWRRSMRSGQPLALLMVDVDHFKSYNDRYGHPEGDLCLRALAATLSVQIRRPGDVAARYGGEEFALILPSTSLEGARDFAERLAATIRDQARPHEGTSLGIVTISIGCAALVPDRHDHVTRLIEAADGALYAAKRAGRNCVEIAAPALATAPGDLVGDPVGLVFRTVPNEGLRRIGS